MNLLFSELVFNIPDLSKTVFSFQFTFQINDVLKLRKISVTGIRTVVLFISRQSTPVRCSQDRRSCCSWLCGRISVLHSRFEENAFCVVL